MSMSMNLKDYMKVYDDFLNVEECDSILNELKNNYWERHSFYTYETDKTNSNDDDLYVSRLQFSNKSNILQNRIGEIVRDYIVQLNLPWLGGLMGYTQIRYNKYNVGNRMRLHCDHIHSMFDGDRKGIPTLSVLGALNDDYEGGDLIFWEKEKIELKARQIMVFPSIFLYPHEVTTVTQGTRYSFISWVW